MTKQRVNKWAGVFLVVLSITVSIPLTIKSIQTNGGTWGFGMVGLPILLPLSAYIFFGVAALTNGLEVQRKIFILAHIVTLSIGLITLFIFPVYPSLIVLIPVALAIIGIISKNKFQYFLTVMILLGVIADILLLKWEIDFGRTVPLLQLFQATQEITP